MGMGLGQGSIMGMGLGQGNIVERYSFMHSEKSSPGIGHIWLKWVGNLWPKWVGHL